jgi:hypothetical protein
MVERVQAVLESGERGMELKGWGGQRDWDWVRSQ